MSPRAAASRSSSRASTTRWVTQRQARRRRCPAAAAVGEQADRSGRLGLDLRGGLSPSRGALPGDVGGWSCRPGRRPGGAGRPGQRPGPRLGAGQDDDRQLDRAPVVAVNRTGTVHCGSGSGQLSTGPSSSSVASSGLRYVLASSTRTVSPPGRSATAGVSMYPSIPPG